ncbi:MAG TPA: pitrilysin family protein [Kofleriaceae bacterium]|nr:pitrilysin family protein [Kofleriaceae bacterium]
MKPLVLVALLAGAVAAQPAAKPAPAAKSTLSLPSIETFTLDNGLQVAFMHRDGAPVVSVEVWYHVGSKDEPRNRRGSAHMFEHIMFKGTEHVPPEAHAKELNRLGGYVNAQTTEDATHYINLLPADYLDFALQLEAERMRHLLFREDMIKTEREVVKEEIRQQDNNPLLKAVNKFLAAAYTKHPYAWTAAGNIADLDATTPDDLHKFYDLYYQPNNALLVVVGNVTREQVETSAKKWFGAIPKGATPPRPADEATEPAQTEQRKVTSEPAQLGVIIAGYHVPAAKEQDIYGLQVLSLILGGGESSRLMQRIKQPIDPKAKQPKPLGVAAGTQILVHEQPGLLLVVGAFLDPANQQQVQDALFDEVQKLATKGPDANELRKAKNQIQASYVYGLESVGGIAEQIGESWILTGDPARWLKEVDEFEKVTAADVMRLAKQYLDPKTATILVVPPAGAQ